MRRTRANIAANVAALINDRDSTFADFADFLLAHTLAVISVEKGKEKAAWLAAVTLDRYLHKSKQAQIYGTQYQRDGSGAWTQEPYNKSLIPDSIRKELGVVSLEEQQQTTVKMNQESKKRPNK